MKTKILSILLILALAVPLTAAPPAKHKSTEASALIIDNTTWIDANNIFMFVTNHGNFARDLTDMFHNDAGTFFPFTTIEDLASGANSNYVNYASGLWVGGQVGSETRVTIAEYSDEYVPGPMIGGTFAPDAPEYQVFKLYKDSLAGNPNQDYLDWNLAAQQGAPFTVVDGDTVPDEIMLGDQMLWSVYNDANPAQHLNDAGFTNPLGIEIRQTTFAYDRTDPLGNVIFTRLRVYNKGGNTINNCYFSLWADPDLGGASDDLVGCDTVLSLGYVYNATNNDPQYGSQPPCLGYDFFQGPMVSSPGDTARMWGQLWPDMKNLGMVSFNKYINGTDPNSFDESYNYMQGLQADGTDYINPATGEVSLYFHSGDPVAGTGDLDVNAADRRFMQSTGPITFGPGDSTEILAAIIVGQGSDRLSSVSVMKYYDQFAQSAYDIDFALPEPPAAPQVGVSHYNDEVSLIWGAHSEENSGDFPFEGYTIYQGESAAGPWKRIANYDINNGVGTIIDDYFDIETSTLEQRGVKFGTDPGVKRFFSTKQDFLLGGDLHNYTTYYYKVEAYSYDADATPKTLTSATVVSATPQGPLAGMTYSQAVGDFLEVTHSAGGSNGGLSVEVVDPIELTGDSYAVSFEDTLGIEDGVDIAWHIVNTTTGDTIVAYGINQTGDDDYPTFDGLIVRVLGPAFGVVAIQEVADGSGPITPDNVMYSLNSTADWYISSDQGSNFSRMDWRGHIGTSDWEIRFTAAGSNYYDWNTDGLMPDRAPFEVWNIGVGTPDDTSDDFQINFAYLDDDGSGAWSYGDRLYPWDAQYVEPAPAFADYVWDDDFHIGRIVIQDYSGALTAPVEGTVIRFTTAKVNTSADVFTFSTSASTMTQNEAALEDIKVVPNPFYLYSSYDPAVGNNVIKFTHLQEKCTISIYNLAGEYVDKIEKDDPSTTEAIWNGNTYNGLPIASGVYLFVVDAEGYGQKVGKFAVFKEVETLERF